MNATFIVAIAIAIVGVSVLWRGLRGRRVGNHPFCRRCGFDLFGRPETSHACPECGSNLDQKRATIVGERRRRPHLIAAGVFLLILGLGAGGVVTWVRMNNVNWRMYAPLAVLLHEAKSPDVKLRTDALRELRRRFGKQELSDAQISRIVDAGLNGQADLKTPWSIEWGILIEQAHLSQQVSDAQWNKYLEQAVSLKWMTFDWRRPDGQLRFSAARVGGTNILSAQVAATGMFLDGKELPSARKSSVEIVYLIPGGPTGIDVERDALLEAINQFPSGEQHEGHVLVDVWVMERPSVARPPVNQKPITVQVPFKIQSYRER